MDLSLLIEQIKAQDWIEWTGLITGVIYVILATYEKPSCWVFGIISSIAIAWKSVVSYHLIADGLLQLFYVAMGVLGLLNWLNGKKDGHEKPIIISPLKEHAIAIGICFLLAYPLSYIMINFLGARYGYLDTLITLGSIWATILLVRKELFNWVYWIVLDFMLIFLYFVSGAYLFSLLFLVYTGIAVLGYYIWKKHLTLAD
ncbi:MAG: nicotinamide riboside transporter PnuC [Bacteroidota bacterium]|nr:nicotinamide riboside transporter PnuC [Bacteroidota bacterium]